MEKSNKNIKLLLILLSVLVGIGLFMARQVYLERKTFTNSMKHFRNPDVRIREFAEIVLIVGGDRNVPKLLESIEVEEDITVKIGLIKILGKIGNKAATDVVINHLTHEDRDVRLAAAWALAGLNDERAIEPLKTVVITEEDIAIRARALLTIGEIDNFNDVEYFEDLLKNDRFDDSFKQKIKRVIKRIKDRDINKPPM